MDNPKILSEGFTCEELAEALLVKLKPFIQESIREELAKMQEDIQPEISNKNHKGQITPIEPQVADTGRYSVTEASKALGIHRTTLFKAVKNNAIKCGIRKSNNRKFFLGADIKKLWKSSY